MTQFTIIVSVCAGIVTIISLAKIVVKFFKNLTNKIDKLDAIDDIKTQVTQLTAHSVSQDEALKSLLRSQITSTYYKHIDSKSLREYDYQQMLNAADSYFALGGNSYVRDLYDRMCDWEIVE